MTLQPTTQKPRTPPHNKKPPIEVPVCLPMCLAWIAVFFFTSIVSAERCTPAFSAQLFWTHSMDIVVVSATISFQSTCLTRKRGTLFDILFHSTSTVSAERCTPTIFSSEPSNGQCRGLCHHLSNLLLSHLCEAYTKASHTLLLLCVSCFVLFT